MMFKSEFICGVSFRKKVNTRIPPSSFGPQQPSGIKSMLVAIRSPRSSRVSNPLSSLFHTGRRRAVLGHTVNILWHVVTKRSHNVSSKFMFLYWATFTAMLGCMQPMGCRLDTLADTSAWIAPRKPNYYIHVLLFSFPPEGGATEQYWPQCTAVNRWSINYSENPFIVSYFLYIKSF